MGDVIGHGHAPNKKLAEKLAALDACTKLAQLGRLLWTGSGKSKRHGNINGKSNGGGGGKHGGGSSGNGKVQMAGDVGAVALCATEAHRDALIRIGQTLDNVPNTETKTVQKLIGPHGADETVHGRHAHAHAHSLDDTWEVSRQRDACEVDAWNARHQDMLRQREANAEYVRMLDKTRELPAYKMKDMALGTIMSNRVTIVSGDTGCGKTTQVWRARGCGAFPLFL